MLLPTDAPIRPIETPYAGRLFRSRLEARWAVFYDVLGIPWMYEPQGFALDAGDGSSIAYLPDFFLPVQHCYIEIKPCTPTASERRKAALLAHHAHTRVYIFFGTPGYHVDGGYPSGQLGLDGAYLYDGDREDLLHAWCVCLRCGQYGIEYCGRSERLSCNCHATANKVYTYDDPRLLRAYDWANRARFVVERPC